MTRSAPPERAKTLTLRPGDLIQFSQAPYRIFNRDSTSAESDVTHRKRRRDTSPVSRSRRPSLLFRPRRAFLFFIAALAFASAASPHAKRPASGSALVHPRAGRASPERKK